MNITLAGTTVTATQCLSYEHANGKRELRVVIPQSEITYTDLKALLAVNDGIIVETKDDGTTTTYVGYTEIERISEEKLAGVDVYKITFLCVAEAERRAREAQQQVAEAKQQIVGLSTELAKQTEYVAELEEAVALADETTIELYEAQLAQDEANNAQDEAIIELYELYSTI